jgi:hypothetical protein
MKSYFQSVLLDLFFPFNVNRRFHLPWPHDQTTTNRQTWKPPEGEKIYRPGAQNSINELRLGKESCGAWSGARLESWSVSVDPYWGGTSMWGARGSSGEYRSGISGTRMSVCSVHASYKCYLFLFILRNGIYWIVLFFRWGVEFIDRMICKWCGANYSLCVFR